jgi:hypothetical protein
MNMLELKDSNKPKSVKFSEYNNLSLAVADMAEFQSYVSTELATIESRKEILESELDARWKAIFEALKQDGVIKQDADYDAHSLYLDKKNGTIKIQMRAGSFKAFLEGLAKMAIKEKIKVLSELEDARANPAAVN